MHSDRCLFEYELTPLAKVVPWGSPNEQRLHWFGLTQGCFWMRAAGVELFRYTDEILAIWGMTRQPYVDYYVVRLWEDLLELYPRVAEPVPAELFIEYPDLERLLSRSSPEPDGSAGESRELDDVRERAGRWWWDRSLDTGYLAHPIAIHVWRQGDWAFVRWNDRKAVREGCRVWAAGEGQAELSWEAFVSELRGFHERLMSEMRIRVEAVRIGGTGSNVDIDVDALVREHAEREAEGESTLRAARPFPTDWSEVMAALAELRQVVARRAQA